MHSLAASTFFSVMLNVGARQWDAFTRLETRTKESNRRARERIIQVPSLVLKGRSLTNGVHTTRMPNTVRPARGLRLSVPVWTRKVVNYA